MTRIGGIGIKQYKCIVILSDLPRAYNNALLGFVF